MSISMYNPRSDIIRSEGMGQMSTISLVSGDLGDGYLDQSYAWEMRVWTDTVRTDQIITSV